LLKLVAAKAINHKNIKLVAANNSSPKVVAY